MRKPWLLIRLQKKRSRLVQHIPTFFFISLCRSIFLLYNREQTQAGRKLHLSSLPSMLKKTEKSWWFRSHNSRIATHHLQIHNARLIPNLWPRNQQVILKKHGTRYKTGISTTRKRKVPYYVLQHQRHELSGAFSIWCVPHMQGSAGYRAKISCLGISHTKGHVFTPRGKRTLPSAGLRTFLILRG